MARTTRTAPEAIIATLKRAPKRGLTATAISERAGINLNTVRTTIYALASSGQVTRVGRETPSFGRPANLYRLAEAA